MGVRIAALWRHLEDGKRYVSGEISVDTGLVLIPGQKLMCRIVNNEKKTPGDKYPDAFLEAWYPRPRDGAGDAQGGQAESPDDSMPF